MMENENENCSIRFTKDESDQSMKLIEENSNPDIILPVSSDQIDTVIFQNSINSETGEDTFCKLDKAVSELDISDTKNFENLDNTLDVIDFILKNGNINKLKNNPVNCINNEMDFKADNVIQPTTKRVPNEIAQYNISKQESNKPLTYCQYHKDEKKTKTEMLNTPTNKLRENTPCFKTPSNPISSTKESCASLKKIPSKSRYQYISSPVAAYINNSPQVPLIKNVFPKKPLPSCVSSSEPTKPKAVTNKVNINLPFVAYKSAKITEVIDIPDKNKLPQCEWVKNIASTTPKALVFKHERREIYPCKKPLQCNQDDSFANLPLHQAEVSLCTQKSAFNRP